MIKRVLKIVGAAVLAVVLGGVALIAITLSGNSPIEDGKELGSGVRTVTDGHVSLFVVDVGANKVALVDAGNNEHGNAILAELARRNLGPDDVLAVFITHGHVDHIAGCHLFPKAQVLVLEPDVALASGKAKSHGPVTGLLGPQDKHVVVTRPLHDGETVTVGNVDVRVFAVPGHTAGSAAFLANGVLFFGDSASATPKGELAPAVWAFSDDRDQNRASLRALAKRLEPERAKVTDLAFGHSGPLHGLDPLLAFASAP